MEPDHRELAEKLEHLETEIREHVHPEIQEIATALWGPELTEVQGGGRDHDRGLVARTERIERKLDRVVSDLPSGLSPKERVAIYTTAAMAVASVLAAVVEGFFGLFRG